MTDQPERLGGDQAWLNRHNRPTPEPQQAAAPTPSASGPGPSGPGNSDTGNSGPAQPEAVEAEIVDADDLHATIADELLAEVFDEAQLEADLAAAQSEAAIVADQVDSATVRDEVAGLTADLQRVQAEFRNYKRRVERDRDKDSQRAVEKALTALLPVLDDLELADQHDELVGGFKSVAEKFVGILSGLGLTAFGAVGEPFDPSHHEALMRESVEGITEPTVVRVLQVGYEMNGRIIRAARVSVAGTD